MYYMPRPHRDLTICGHSHFSCVKWIKQEIQSAKNESFLCNCLYACHAIQYDMALSSTPIFEQAPLIIKNNLTSKNTAILHVYYQSTFYRSQNKEQLVGLTEFLCMHQKSKVRF